MPQIGSTDVVENVHQYSWSLIPLVNMPNGCCVTICRNVARNSRTGEWDQGDASIRTRHIVLIDEGLAQWPKFYGYNKGQIRIADCTLITRSTK